MTLILNSRKSFGQEFLSQVCLLEVTLFAGLSPDLGNNMTQRFAPQMQNDEGSIFFGLEAARIGVPL